MQTATVAGEGMAIISWGGGDQLKLLITHWYDDWHIENCCLIATFGCISWYRTAAAAVELTVEA